MNYSNLGTQNVLVVASLIVLLGLTLLTTGASGGEIKLLDREHDPFGFPRPGNNHKNIPLKTSFYFELQGPDASDQVADSSISFRLETDGLPIQDILHFGKHFEAGYTGNIFGNGNWLAPSTKTSVYIESEVALKPSTTYTAVVKAQSQKGTEAEHKWSFTTETAPSTEPLQFDLDLNTPKVHWSGSFFSGFVRPSFCTTFPEFLPSFDLMNKARKKYPNAWIFQRDFWMTGMDYKPSFLPNNLPGIVRELETRHVVAVNETPDGTLLHVDSFYGCEQYGIPKDRKLTEDYHPGDVVLIADSVHSATAVVVKADDGASTLLTSAIKKPDGGWKLEYLAKLPEKEDPNAPGLFPPGGCHLRKFNPCGTPKYYWGRLDKEWDLAVKKLHRRLMPNFADAPGDLSMDGRNWNTAKDYAELHQVTYDITTHLIDRYGKKTLDFYWCVFNEPDLSSAFWHSDWIELQKFYDYTVDAVLRAFEDRGYDSEKVVVGGLELGACFGLRLNEFFEHCSPIGKGPGVLEKNAAFADTRLTGRRSRRVEKLCGAHGGKGSPCDLVSVHGYNRSDTLVAKLSKSKEIALDIDPDYYETLRVDSHESCPDWAPPADPAAMEANLSNGYFTSWCADATRRLLARASEDSRYSYGDIILTFWPWPAANFRGGNGPTRSLYVDDDGDGKKDRVVTVPTPIFHFLNLSSTMGADYWVLPDKGTEGEVISGFLSRSRDDVRALLYSHDPQDSQSKSEKRFDVTMRIVSLDWKRVRVKEYRFDCEENSPLQISKRLKVKDDVAPGVLVPPACYTPQDAAELEKECQLRCSRTFDAERQKDGSFSLPVTLRTNGASFLIIEPRKALWQTMVGG